jgi:hypothetical protein
MVTRSAHRRPSPSRSAAPQRLHVAPPAVIIGLVEALGELFSVLRGLGFEAKPIPIAKVPEKHGLIYVDVKSCWANPTMTNLSFVFGICHSYPATQMSIVAGAYLSRPTKELDVWLARAKAAPREIIAERRADGTAVVIWREPPTRASLFARLRQLNESHAAGYPPPPPAASAAPAPSTAPLPAAAPAAVTAPPKERFEWKWTTGDGKHWLEIDFVGGDMVWLDEYTPRGDLGITLTQAIEAFLATGPGTFSPSAPADVVAAARAAIAPRASTLLARPPQDRLVAAARMGDMAALIALLDAGAQSDAPDVRGRTALWAAFDNGHDAAALALIERGADIHTRGPKTNTFGGVGGAGADQLVVALAGRMFATARALLERGADPARPPPAWHLWVIGYREHAPIELIRAMIAKSPPLAPSSGTAIYAMNLAAGRGDVEMIRWLTSLGVAPPPPHPP